MFIDTHAHVNFKAFKDDADEVLQRSLKAGVLVVNVGSQYSTSKRALEMAERFETGVWAIVGMHPIHLKKRSLQYQDDEELEMQEIETSGEDFDYAKYLELAKNPKVVAVGEIGLDYHHFEEGDNIEELKIKQKEVFIQSIKLANEVQKPVMIHCWDAYDDLLEILQKYPVAKKGIVHSFVGGYKTAKKFTEMGYLIGLNGVITYSESFDRLIHEVPLESIVLETDCPYLTPVPHKGERNEPVYVQLVAKKIAQIKQIPVEEVARVTTENAKKALNI
jgi:TatD DNase family protein